MFTGLIQKIGTLKRISRGAGMVVEIGFEPWQMPLEDGESVAVDGVCLTVAKHDATRFTADVLDETRRRTGFDGMVPGTKVNLERALKAGDPMGGHIVQGHVDGRGTITSVEKVGRDFRLRIRCGRVIAAQTVLKGSIAVDGVSLTVSGIGDDWLTVDVIPSTAAATTIGSKRTGDKVNLESDVVGKHLSRTVEHGLTEKSLQDAGFI